MAYSTVLDIVAAKCKLYTSNVDGGYGNNIAIFYNDYEFVETDIGIIFEFDIVELDIRMSKILRG